MRYLLVDLRPVSIMAVTIAVAALALAVLVLAARPRARMNQSVSTLLALSAWLAIATTWRHEPVLPDAWQYALASSFYLGAAAIGPSYLWVLSSLPGRMTRWLRVRWVLPASLAIPVAAAIPFFLDPTYPHKLDESIGAVNGFAMLPLAVLGALVSLYALVAAYDSWRTETLPAARRMARSFLVAFGLRDAVLAAALSINAYNVITGQLPELYDPTIWGGFANNLPLLAEVFFLPALAFAVLRMQLMDFRWQLRLTVNKATLVTIVVALVVAAFEVGTERLEGALGTLPAVIVTAVLILFLTPLQRLTERVSERAVPDAQPLEALPEPQKADLYMEQVQLAWHDGLLSTAERRMLDGMADRLGLSTASAARLEKQALGR